MKDVVLSAKMSDQELLASIDATLKSSEQKFTTFASDINSILMNIGSNVGQNLSSNFGSQVDAMKSKIDELNSKIKSMESPTVSSGAGSVPSVNINDYNSSITTGMQQQDFELLKLNEHYRLLEISSQKAFNAQRSALKMDISVASKLPTNNIDEINDKLKRLQELKARISSGPTQLLNPAEIQSLDTKITNLTHKVEILQTKIKQPITMSGVMSMPEGNLNAIAAKMKAISELRGSYSAGAPELTQLNQAYQRLGKTQTEALTAGVKLEKNNHSLAASFENLGRRVMFYAGLGAITGFVVQLFNIRGEYEMLERSMGALLGNFQKGSEIFNQIQAKALKSPLTVIDLTSAAKQMIAYNFAEDQVVDTTSRLADLSTALGVPIERLVYNLGQIKSKNVLDSRDARDFANAGFAIVPMLAQLYTEQKRFGDQTVTTAQVYDMMTKKMVSYGDVMSVINKQTNEGGMFFDFQAKQAQTLKGQLSNLTDAWNMMLNEMGKENQGVMTGLVSGTRAALANWKEIERAIIGLIAGYGAFKAAQLVLNATMGQGAIGIKSGILASKQKIATDLMMKQAIRELTLEEQSALEATKSISAEEYTAALRTKGFTNEQLMLRYAMAGKNSVTRQAIVATGQLTEAEIANAAAMGRSGAAMGIVSMGLTKMGMAVKTFFIANWPLLAITAAISLVTYLINKHEEHKQKVQELNDEYNNLRKNLADISVNFKVAVQKNDIEDAKSKLEELIKFAKDEYSIVINVDTSKMNTKEIVKKFNDIKNELNDIEISSKAFSEASIGSGFGDEMLKYGEDLGKMYGIILNNKNTLADALQTHIEKLKALGGQTQEVAKYQAILNNIMTPKRENETQIDYLNRLTTAYANLGIFSNKLTEEGRKAYNRFEELGISGDKTFSTLRDSWNNIFYHSDPTAAWIKQLDELAKSINFDNIPKEKRTIKLEAAINKLATDQKWNEFAKEQAIKMANARFHINIAIETDKASQNKATLDLTNWRDNLQDYFNKHGFQIGVDLKTANAGEIAQKAGSEYESRKGSVQAIQNQLAYSKEQLAIEEKRLKAIPSISKKYSTQFQAVANARNAVKSLTNELEKSKKEVDAGRNAAARAGYDFKKENQDAIKATKAKSTAQKKSLSEEAQTIKNEIELIDKLSSGYDKLVGAGMSKDTAISFLAKEYKRSIGEINKTLNKYNIPKFNIEDFAGKDISGQLAYLEKLRDAMKANGLDKLKPDAYKEVSLQIEKITVDAKTYDLSRITDGLQESLNNIKESYELGIEIDSEAGFGDVFATMFGINRSKLPKDAEDAVKQMTDEWNKAIDKYNITNIKSPIKKVDILSTTPQQFNEIQNVNVKSGIAENYKKVFDAIYGIAKTDAEKTVKEYNDLNYKLADNAGKIGIEEQKLSLLQTRYAQETNNEKKRLLELQITDEKNTIERLKEESLKLVPFYRDLFADTYNKSNATLERIIEKVKEVTNTAQEVDVNGEKKIQLSFPDQSGKIKKTTISAEEYLRILKQIDSLTKETTESNPWKKIADDFSKVTKDGKTKLKNPIEGVKDLAAEGHKAANKVKELSQIFSDLGASDDTVETLSDIGTTIDGLSTAAEGAAQIASGDYIRGTVNVIKGTWTAVSTWFDNKNKKIDKQIKESELTVKNLENAYKSLDRAISSAMGDAEIGAKRAAIANKQLQLIELQRQLTLEKSRSSKKQDKSKIADLEGQIIDLKNSITDTTNSIVTDLLGISSTKDAAESLVSNMIEAFRNGEDYMKLYSESFDKMIDNMIMKAIVSKVIGTKIDELMNTLQTRIDSRTVKEKQALDKATANASLTEADIATNLIASGDTSILFNKEERSKKIKERKDLYLKQYQDALDAYNNVSAVTPEDVNMVRQDANAWKDNVKTTIEQLTDAYGIKFGNAKTSALSGLQQGIQNITEEQGGAIESYMNGVSGQVYLHTTLLQQLYANSNVSLGTQSQILLQMQTSYQVQMSIQNIMQGWSSNNGRSVKVEIV